MPLRSCNSSSMGSFLKISTLCDKNLLGTTRGSHNSVLKPSEQNRLYLWEMVTVKTSVVCSTEQALFAVSRQRSVRFVFRSLHGKTCLFLVPWCWYNHKNWISGRKMHVICWIFFLAENVFAFSHTCAVLGTWG